MKNRDEFEQAHWRCFNRLAKVTGHFFLWGGLYGFVLLVLYFVDPELFSEMGRFGEDMQAFKGSELESAAAFAVVAVFGYLLLRMTPYFPK